MKQEVLPVKKRLMLVLSVLFVLTVFTACSAPLKPSEPTTQAAVQPTQEASAPADGSPFFQLSSLPKIGPYYDGTVYQRMTADYVDKFQPSDQYGTLLPYIGDYRLYRSEETGFEDEDWSFDDQYPRYGLMKADGAVVTDAVYENIYTENGLYFLYKSDAVNGKSRVQMTILPINGKWSIEQDYEDWETSYCGSLAKAQRIFAFSYETKSVAVYDFNGKKLFDKQNISEFSVCEEAECFTVRVEKGEKTFTTLLDKNGRELKTIQGYIYSCKDCTNYFIGELVEWFRDGDGYDTVSKSGILKKDGSWLIKPIYDNTSAYQDKYFICGDDHTTTVLDENLKKVFTADADEIEFNEIEWFNNEPIHWKSNGEESACYTILGGHKPIMANGKELVSVEPFFETNLFLGVDANKNGYLFTRDGTVKKTIADIGERRSMVNERLLEISTGEEKKLVSHVIDAKTMEEKYSFVCHDESSNMQKSIGYPEEEAQTCVECYVFPIESDDYDTETIYQVIEIETGKTLVDACDYVRVYHIDGKDYYCGVKDNTAFLIEAATGQALLRMPCSYVD